MILNCVKIYKEPMRDGIIFSTSLINSFHLISFTPLGDVYYSSLILTTAIFRFAKHGHCKVTET